MNRPCGDLQMVLRPELLFKDGRNDEKDTLQVCFRRMKAYGISAIYKSGLSSVQE